MTPCPLHVLLLGDSTVMGSVPHQFAPHADHLEDVIRKRLALDPTHPPVVVTNKGLDNDTIRRMLAERYERDVAALPVTPDYIFIRFGINDRHYLADWRAEFPQTYRRLVSQLRRDCPRALITIETVIPYCTPAVTKEINDVIRPLAAELGCALLDTHAAYASALEHGANMLTYRRVLLSEVPPALRAMLPAGAITDDCVTILDHVYDPHFSHLPNWFSDRHPNLAGFHVIGKCVADYLAGLIRR